MILDKLKQFVSSASAPSEAHTQRNGAFSYRAETHAFGWGVGLGVGIVLAAWLLPTALPALGGAALLLLVYAFTERRLNAVDVEVPDQAYREAHKEPVYYGVGLGSGLVIGMTVLAAVVVLI